jgi:uncharacterized protein YdhG (YjbR/CyaY superfamily)
MTERTSDQDRIAPEVHDYLAAVPAENRRLFDQLHELVLDALPDARVVLSYKMPAYVVPGGRVSLSSGRTGVSLATTWSDPVVAFKAKHGRFKTGKVTVQFPPDAELPADDIRELVRAAVRAH